MEGMRLHEIVLQALRNAQPDSLTTTELHRARLSLAGLPISASGTGATYACVSTLAVENSAVEAIPGPPRRFRYIGDGER